MYLFQNGSACTLKLSKVTQFEPFYIFLQYDTSSGNVDHQEFVFNFFINSGFLKHTLSFSKHTSWKT